MTLRKITEYDLEGKGVIGMPDVPELTATEMQKKVEEIVRDVVIPLFNSNVDKTATKEELENAVFQSGSGNMSTMVYDKNGDGKVDNAENGFATYTHSMTGRGHLLEGVGENIKFVATQNWSLRPYLEVNGRQAIPYNSNNEDISAEEVFKKGAVVSCFLHRDRTEGILKCFFKTGGAKLNFSVVGGIKEPASPEENALWAVTTTAVKNWFMSPSQPESRQTGDLWIITGSVGSIRFNALKENGLTVYVTGAKQYDGTAWVDKDIQRYIGGRWIMAE